jgi:L-ribulose-5-phosphate 4-epimerase
MLKKVRQRVYKANMALPEYGLVAFTWGNASEIDESRRYVAIKPSGVRYADLSPDIICVVDIEDGRVVDGDHSPSTDMWTHLELYRRFAGIGGVVHTHSAFATAFAQAGMGIPCYGTTHADYFYGEIPCARPLTPEEITDAYELNTGRVIAETYERRAIDPMAAPGALVSGHGPFAWGRSASDAAANAAYLEEVARLAHYTRNLAGDGICGVPQALADKHYFRKHGPDAYYGQHGGGGDNISRRAK